MGSDSIYTFIDAIIGAGGIYIIYLTAKMMKTGELSQNGLVSKNVNIKECKDVAGYIKFMGPRQLAFGILALFCGIIGLVHDFTGILGANVYLIGTVLVIIYLIYYAIQSKKAVQMFW